MGPLTASDINGDELTLTWNPPKDNGGKRINNYIIEKRPAGSTRWQKVSSFASSPRCNVRNLDPGTEYEFRVMAENDEGVSEPLETAEAILAKLPFGKYIVLYELNLDAKIKIGKMTIPVPVCSNKSFFIFNILNFFVVLGFFCFT